jgi:hypothetical protein
MTHRSNPHSLPSTAHRAAQPRAGVAQAKRIDITVINVALASLVVVVLITTLTGAG